MHEREEEEEDDDDEVPAAASGRYLSSSLFYNSLFFLLPLHSGKVPLFQQRQYTACFSISEVATVWTTCFFFRVLSAQVEKNEKSQRERKTENRKRNTDDVKENRPPGRKSSSIVIDFSTTGSH